ncbi:MAG: ABC transporter permease subunit [Phycisphaeraceae bacterium]
MLTLYRWLWYLLPANPVFQRIIQGGSRRWRHFWVRTGYLGALVVLIVFGLLLGGGMAQASITQLAKAGTNLFAIVSYGQVILVCLLAPLFMAGAISQEQSGETYDILLTTPMSNLQIVLGSLLGRLFFVLALLLSGLPLFSVLLIFGGVPMASIFVAFAVAALVTMVVGAVAIALSVSRKGGRKAVYVFVITIAAYLVSCYAIDLLVRNLPGAGLSLGGAKQTTVLTPLHPLLVLESYLNSANYQPPTPEDLADRSWLVRFYLGKPLAAFATLSVLISMALVLWSALLVRRIGQGDGKVMLAVKRWLRLGAEGRRRGRARTVWANPIAWREANARGNRFMGIVGRWGFAILGWLAAVYLLLAYHNRWPTFLSGGPMDDQQLSGALLALMSIELAVIGMVAIYMSAGSVSREREDGTLDLLLTTPVTPHQYVWGKVRGLVSFLLLLIAVPVVTLAILSVYQLLSGAKVSYSPMSMSMSGSAVRPLFLVDAALLFPLMLVPFVAFCVTTGMWWSIKSRGVLGAVIPTVAIVGVLSLFLGLCGYNMAENVPIVGPIINAASPTTSLSMLMNPWERVTQFGDDPIFGRISLFIAALLAGGAYSLIVYGLLQTMVKSFDQTVRRLSGTGA